MPLNPQGTLADRKTETMITWQAITEICMKSCQTAVHQHPPPPPASLLPCWNAATRGLRSGRRTWSGSTSTGSHSRLQTWSCGKCRRSVRRPGDLPLPWPVGPPSPCSWTTAAGFLWKLNKTGCKHGCFDSRLCFWICPFTLRLLLNKEIVSQPNQWEIIQKHSLKYGVNQRGSLKCLWNKSCIKNNLSHLNRPLI